MIPDPLYFVKLKIYCVKNSLKKVIKNFQKGIDKSKFLIYNVLVRLIKQPEQNEGGNKNEEHREGTAVQGQRQEEHL